MGGGNGAKSAAARDRNLAKKLKDQKQKNHDASRAKMNADKEQLKCKICMTTFLITANVRRSPTSLCVYRWILMMMIVVVACLLVCMCADQAADGAL